MQEKLAQGLPRVIRFRLETGVEPFQDIVFGWTHHEVAQVGPGVFHQLYFQNIVYINAVVDTNSKQQEGSKTHEAKPGAQNQNPPASLLPCPGKTTFSI